MFRWRFLHTGHVPSDSAAARFAGSRPPRRTDEARESAPAITSRLSVRRGLRRAARARRHRTSGIRAQARVHVVRRPLHRLDELHQHLPRLSLSPGVRAHRRVHGDLADHAGRHRGRRVPRDPHPLAAGQRDLPLPLLSAGCVRWLGWRAAVAVHVATRNQSVELCAQRAGIPDARRVTNTEQSANRVRTDRILDRCWCVDPRDPRGSDQHSQRRARSSGAGRRQPGSDGATHQTAADQEVGRVHAHRVLRWRHPVVRRTRALQPSHSRNPRGRCLVPQSARDLAGISDRQLQLRRSDLG